MPHLSWNEVRDRAIRFSREHAADRSESADKQTFWNDFFHVFGLRRASLASFEANVRNLHGNTGAIDLLWKGRLLVEHKSFGQDLGLAETQAFTYIEDLTREQRWDEIPRFVLISDFARFVLYDLEPEEQRDLPLFAGRQVQPHHFTLAEFPRHVRHFAFMLGQTRVRLDPEDPANEKAYDRMCELHDALKSGGFTGHELERLLVRILFCMFAEDTAIFAPDAFTQFIRTQTRADGTDLGAKLNELFDWLNNPASDGPLPDTDPFYGFRYVNGGLFAERLGFPRFTRAMRDALLFCCDFQWARISPAVFGSLFQGVLEDRARRQQGAHYTSERDIMKVVRALFLDDLHAEWDRVKNDRSTRRRANIDSYHERLSKLRFLDPACGCGNFLVLAYRELRALEFDVIRTLHGDQQGILDVRRLCRVDVHQFHGIEISEWPVRIAEVAMWLMDHQMNSEASGMLGQSFERLPLASSPHIVHANALRLDWNTVLPAADCTHVLGNPPFVGKHYQSAAQRDDMREVFGSAVTTGDLDFVTCWYVKAARYIAGTRIPVAFVSTNSITQGEQVPVLWSVLFRQHHLKIHFAHRTFAWQSEARGRAHVHVVIIGFGAFDIPRKKLTDYDADPDNPVVVEVDNITPYLTPGPDSFVTKHRQPICPVPAMRCGNKPTDGGAFLFTDEEHDDFLREEPGAVRFFRRFTGSEEFINGNMRWCLWLKDAAPHELRSLPRVMERVERVRNMRINSTARPTREAASRPTLFFFDSQPDSRFIAIPEVSSEQRTYIPIGFLDPDIIASNKLYLIASQDMFLFGVLSSSMHMAWVKVVGGRLESRYQYSGSMVYNTFPWPSGERSAVASGQDARAPVGNSSEASLRAKVEACAQAVLAAREPHLPPRGLSTLADLYDPLTMPAELAKAHAALDRAVEKCYRPEPFHSDRERVEFLFRLYERLTAPLLPSSPASPAQRRRQSAPAASRPRRGRTPGLPAAPSADA